MWGCIMKYYKGLVVIRCALLFFSLGVEFCTFDICKFVTILTQQQGHSSIPTGVDLWEFSKQFKATISFPLLFHSDSR